MATFDAAVRRFLGSHPAGTVVALGEGLETQFWRLDNGQVRWLTVDLPETMDLRHRLLPDGPRQSSQLRIGARPGLGRAAGSRGLGKIGTSSAGFSARPTGRSTSVRDGLRDDAGMIDLRWALLVVFVVAAAAVSACGSSSSSTSSSTSSTATSTTAGSGSGVAAARQKCLDATKKIQNQTARSTAEQACNRITTSNANVSTALAKAKQACLSAAAKIPIASIKQSAQAQCNKITAQ